MLNYFIIKYIVITTGFLGAPTEATLEEVGKGIVIGIPITCGASLVLCWHGLLVDDGDG